MLQGSAMDVHGVLFCVQGIGLLLLLLFCRRTQQGKKIKQAEGLPSQILESPNILRDISRSPIGK